jgi:hypothetical protein
MKKHLQLFLLSFLTLCAYSVNAQSDVILTAVWDGNLTGQLPKGVELYVVNDVPDMSIYGIGAANNGQGTDGVEFTFPAIAYSAGTYVYVASESPQFTGFFGFAPNHVSTAVNINGDDAIELFMNGMPVDVFGEIEYAVFDNSWSYNDAWAYRVNGTGPDGTTYIPGNWTMSGPNVLTGVLTNNASSNPIPVGTYSPIFTGSPTVSFSTGSFSVDENAGSVDVTVTITNPDADNDTSVDIEIIAGTAVENVDYTFLSPVTVTFAAGSNASQTVTITLIDNGEEDGDRTIELALSNATNDANIGNGLLTITVEDDDAVAPLYDIAFLREVDPEFYPLQFGSFGEIRGVVHGINLRPSGLEFTLIDPTDGIAVFRNTGNLGYTVQEGDSIHAIGFVGFFNGMVQFLAQTINFIEAGVAINLPQAVTALNEATESNVIKLECVTLVNPAQWTGTGSGFNVTVSNGVETFVVRIRDAVDLYSMPAPSGALNISGIGGQFDNTVPYDGGYQLFPRYSADIVEAGPECTTSLGEANDLSFSLYPNPVLDNLTISGKSQIKQINIYDISGRLIKQVQTNLVNIAVVNFNDLNAGSYLVEVVSTSGKVVKEIVKP